MDTPAFHGRIDKLRVGGEIQNVTDVDEAAELLINLFWSGLKGAPAERG